MSTITIAVPFFGGKGAEKYLPHLKRWWERYNATHTKVSAVVLTDDVTAAEKDMLQGLPLLVVDPRPHTNVVRVLEPGRVWDYKAAIILAALKKLGPTLVVDADTELMQDPEPLLRMLVGKPLMMAPDSGRPPIRTAKGEELVEHNAGVLWFGGDDHRLLIRSYKEIFRELHLDLPHNAVPALLEQATWSVLAHRMQAEELPARLNWQGHFWGPHPETVIRHLHGHGGKLVDVKEAKQPAPPPMRTQLVLIGTPEHGGVTMEFTDARDAVLDTQLENIVWGKSWARGGIVKARNELCANVLETGALGVLMWDSDILANRAPAIQVIEHGLSGIDILGGLYSLKSHPGRWILTELDSRPKADARGILEVYEVGTGFKWVSRRALIRMRDRLPDIFYYSDDMHSKGQPRWNFNAMGVYEKRLLTEDFAFDYLAHAAGLKVYVDTKCVCGHKGSIVYPLQQPAIPGQ